MERLSRPAVKVFCHCEMLGSRTFGCEKLCTNDFRGGPLTALSSSVRDWVLLFDNGKQSRFLLVVTVVLSCLTMGAGRGSGRGWQGSGGSNLRKMRQEVQVQLAGPTRHSSALHLPANLTSPSRLSGSLECHHLHEATSMITPIIPACRSQHFHISC